MTALAFAKLYAVTAPILFAIDLVWLGVVVKDFRAAALGLAGWVL
ncbi:MAG: hypothetical protein ACREU1_14990 [Burkholderiales bacterium]